MFQNPFLICCPSNRKFGTLWRKIWLLTVFYQGKLTFASFSFAYTVIHDFIYLIQLINKKLSFFSTTFTSYTKTNKLYFLTNINRFQPCFKSHLSRFVNKPVSDIGHSKAISWNQRWEKSFGQIFEASEDLPSAGFEPAIVTSLVHVISARTFGLVKLDHISGYTMMWHYELHSMNTSLLN